jgi:hypothetical protein
MRTRTLVGLLATEHASEVVLAMRLAHDLKILVTFQEGGL